MNNSLLDMNLLIKKEADDILYKKGLIDILKSFGTPHIHGSYALDLMTWRDLDIYLHTDTFKEADFFLLGSKLCTLLQPIKMSFRNELIANTPGLPVGLYWGVYLGNERAGSWKIDIWAVDNSEFQKLVRYNTEIRERLTHSAVLSILEIKSQCWKDPEYRRSYNSADIYQAVLEKKITNIDDFKKHFEKLRLKE